MFERLRDKNEIIRGGGDGSEFIAGWWCERYLRGGGGRDSKRLRGGLKNSGR